MTYAYRYLDDYNKPLHNCPVCNADLTKPNAIALTLSIGGQAVEHPTHLDAGGNLIDVENAVANGYHNATYCDACGESLVDNEEQIRGRKTVRLYLDVTFDSSNQVDADGLANALDTLLKTATSTEGILDEYGNPEIGDFFEAAADA